MRIQSLFLISFFAVCGQVLPAMAQSDWVSVEEMRRLFLDRYKEYVKKKQTPGYHRYIAVSPLANMDHKCMAFDRDRRRTYVIGCLEKDNTLSVPDIVDAIYKQEYDGSLDELQYPLNYLGSGVSGIRRVVQRQAGEEIMSLTREVKKPKSLSNTYGSYYSDVYISSDGEYVELAQLDGERPCWTRDIRSEIMGLTDMINAAWVKEKHDFKTGFFYGGSVLLYVSPEGKMDMETLFVEDPSPNDEKVFALLRKVVRDLPPWTMSYLWRTDGKVFPGRYLKCILMPHGMWRIEDYLEDVLLEVKRTDSEAVSVYYY